MSTGPDRAEERGAGWPAAPSYTPPRPATSREMRESLIAAELTIEGKIEGTGHVRIAGRFKGDVHVQGNLAIEVGAVLSGGVRAETVTIGGSSLPRQRRHPRRFRAGVLPRRPLKAAFPFIGNRRVFTCAATWSSTRTARPRSWPGANGARYRDMSVSCVQSSGHSPYLRRIAGRWRLPRRHGICPACRRHCGSTGEARRAPSFSPFCRKGRSASAGRASVKVFILLSIRSRCGNDIARQVVGVGALHADQQRTFTLT